MFISDIIQKLYTIYFARVIGSKQGRISPLSDIFRGRWILVVLIKAQWKDEISMALNLTEECSWEKAVFQLATAEYFAQWIGIYKTPCTKTHLCTQMLQESKYNLRVMIKYIFNDSIHVMLSQSSTH